MADVEERGFLKAIKENAADVATRLAYADWLEEHGRRHDAMMQRAAANVSWLAYKLRRKSDGLFATGTGLWNDKGKAWAKLGLLKQHLTGATYSDRYYGTPWGDLEIAVFEMPLQPAVVLALSGQRGALVTEEQQPS